MKTLYNTVQQYESILDPDQVQTMNRMTDDMIRGRIREYCTNTKENGFVANLHLEITKIDKDKNGWYVETKSNYAVYLMQWSNFKSYYNYCLAKGCKMDEQKGFLIEDLGIYFRWRKHEGVLLIRNSHYLESTDGLPEELNVLFLDYCCGKSKKLTVHNNRGKYLHTVRPSYGTLSESFPIVQSPGAHTDLPQRSLPSARH